MQNQQYRCKWKNHKWKPMHKMVGVNLDLQLHCQDYISSKCKVAVMNIRNIKSIRTYLSMGLTKMLANSPVSPHFDYSSSILYGVPQCSLNMFQQLQYWIAKVVIGYGKYDSVTQVEFQLGWLPINERINSKS